MNGAARETADGNGFSPPMSEGDFRRLGSLIENSCGIRMPASKKTLLQSRLSKRLKELGIASFRDYCKLVMSPEGMEAELIHMIDAVTTNKTEFFREPQHFDFLVRSAVPELLASTGAGVRRDLRLWSAGCATGEEPYTLAMVLGEFAERQAIFDYSVLATDVSLGVLSKAMLGIYGHARVEPVPMEMRKKYLLRSRDRRAGLVRVAPELRRKVSFRWLNLVHEDYGIGEPMDVVFFRNVIIYFERPLQEAILNRICRHLVPGGYLFVGHAEALHALRVPLAQVAPSVYRRTR